MFIRTNIPSIIRCVLVSYTTKKNSCNYKYHKLSSQFKIWRCSTVRKLYTLKLLLINTNSIHGHFPKRPGPSKNCQGRKSMSFTRSVMSCETPSLPFDPLHLIPVNPVIIKWWGGAHLQALIVLLDPWYDTCIFKEDVWKETHIEHCAMQWAHLPSNNPVS